MVRNIFSMESIPVEVVDCESADENAVPDILRKRLPVVIRNVDIGACKSKWTVDYLSKKLESLYVKIHVSEVPQLSFIQKNFLYRTLPFRDFIMRASGESTDHFLNEGEFYYLRSVGVDKRGRDVANISEHFPQIAEDVQIPQWIVDENFFSSVLRISSKGVQIWTHYDVMDNALIQVVGEKRVVLYSPSEVLRMYLKGDKSEVLDIDHPDPELYPEFINVPRYECILKEGDILFIPALWFHNTTALTYGVGLNIFWKNLPHSQYDKSDVYGNKDPLVAQKALSSISKALEDLKVLPEEYQDFYKKRMILMLK